MRGSSTFMHLYLLHTVFIKPIDVTGRIQMSYFNLNITHTWHDVEPFKHFYTGCLMMTSELDPKLENLVEIGPTDEITKHINRLNLWIDASLTIDEKAI